MQMYNSPDIASACPFIKADHILRVVVNGLQIATWKVG